MRAKSHLFSFHYDNTIVFFLLLLLLLLWFVFFFKFHSSSSLRYSSVFLCIFVSLHCFLHLFSFIRSFGGCLCVFVNLLKTTKNNNEMKHRHNYHYDNCYNYFLNQSKSKRKHTHTHPALSFNAHISVWWSQRFLTKKCEEIIGLTPLFYVIYLDRFARIDNYNGWMSNHIAIDYRHQHIDIGWKSKLDVFAIRVYVEHIFDIYIFVAHVNVPHCKAFVNGATHSILNSIFTFILGIVYGELRWLECESNSLNLMEYQKWMYILNLICFCHCTTGSDAIVQNDKLIENNAIR